MVTHSGILAWRIPWTEEPGGLHSSRGCKESEMTEQLTHNCCDNCHPGISFVGLLLISSSNKDLIYGTD